MSNAIKLSGLFPSKAGHITRQRKDVKRRMSHVNIIWHDLKMYHCWTVLCCLQVSVTPRPSLIHYRFCKMGLLFTAVGNFQGNNICCWFICNNPNNLLHLYYVCSIFNILFTVHNAIQSDFITNMDAVYESVQIMMKQRYVTRI